MPNLMNETVEVLHRDGYTMGDIEFVALHETEIELSVFSTFARAFDYNAGYGCAECPEFVLSMSDGTWYERGEYDGSEWWRHVVPPTRPTEQGTISDALFGHSWLYWGIANLETELEEAALEAEYDELMDQLYEWEESLIAPKPLGKWDWRKGRCATKSRCKQLKYSERSFAKGGGAWEYHNSRCWKDQRGKGRNKRYAQYR